MLGGAGTRLDGRAEMTTFRGLWCLVEGARGVSRRDEEPPDREQCHHDAREDAGHDRCEVRPEFITRDEPCEVQVLREPVAPEQEQQGRRHEGAREAEVLE